MKRMWKCVGTAVLLAGVTLAGTANSSAAGNGAAAFSRLKELVGTWELQNGGDIKATTTFELTANGSALLERFVMTTKEGREEMITMYYLDGDQVKLTHYCEAGNQPTMAGEYFPETNTLKFNFLSVTNLKTPNDGHMHHAAYKFIDKDHFQSAWTFRKDQKDVATEEGTYVRVR